MEFLTHDEYLSMDEIPYLYQIGDTIWVTISGKIECGIVATRNDAYNNSSLSIYYIFENLYTKNLTLVEQDDIIENGVVLLIEVIKKELQ